MLSIPVSLSLWPNIFGKLILPRQGGLIISDLSKLMHLFQVNGCAHEKEGAPRNIEKIVPAREHRGYFDMAAK